MKKYVRIPTDIAAVEFQNDQSLEDGYLVYETEYPDEGHYAVPDGDLDTSKVTVLSAAIYNRGEWLAIEAGDYLVVENGEKSVWSKEKFKRVFALA